MRSRMLLTAAPASTIALLAGCASPTPEDDVLAGLGLDGLTGQEIVTRLDASTESWPLDLTTSVREDAVQIGGGATDVTVPLADGTFYVSIAPFIHATHEYYFHSLASCQGELDEEAVEVRITNADGDVLVDERTTTYT